MNEERKGENQALLDHIERLDKERPRLIDVEADGETVSVLLRQGGVTELRSTVDKFLARPRRRMGTATFTDQDSFETHVKRFKNEHTTLWASKGAIETEDHPSVTSVLNYHQSGHDGLAEHGDHRGIYLFPHSEEWREWNESNGKKMTQERFAEFLEGRAQDLVASNQAPDDIKAAMERMGKVIANPLDLVQLSRGLRVNVESEVVNAQNNSSGEVEMVFKSTHATKNKDGGVVHVPGAFVVHIPVFERGEYVTIGAFLRYRVNGSAVSWWYDLYRAHAALDEAFHQVCETTAKKTDVPLFYGTPE